MYYNYIILSTDWDVYRQLYADVIGREDVCYVAGPQAGKRGLKKLLYRIHFNKSLNRLIPLPFKGLWNRSYFKDPFDDNKPLCFVLFRDWISMDAYTGYIDWLKQHYPGAKFIWFLHDLITEHRDFYSGKVLDISKFKRILDLIITCNPTEALQNGLLYHKVPISKLCDGEVTNQCDVLFIGQDKGRLDRLLRIYDSLMQKGARCRFFISGASCQAIDSSREGITFLDCAMPYRVCQSWVAGSNCLLELRYSINAGETLRASEALIYGKKLITDCTALEGNSDFCSDSIRFLASNDNAKGVELSFITTPLDVSPEKTEIYRKKLSPIAFLEEIDALLSKCTSSTT